MSKEGGKRQWTASILKATLQTPDIIPDNNVATPYLMMKTPKTMGETEKIKYSSLGPGYRYSANIRKDR